MVLKQIGKFKRDSKFNECMRYNKFIRNLFQIIFVEKQIGKYINLIWLECERE